MNLESCQASGQKAFKLLNTLLGMPFTDEKWQTMSTKGLFLGLDHNFSTTSTIAFWPRQRLINKMSSLIGNYRTSVTLTSGTALKIYGTMNFLEQGIYGRIGVNGLEVIKLR